MRIHWAENGIVITAIVAAGRKHGKALGFMAADTTWSSTSIPVFTRPKLAIAAACGFQNERYLCSVYKKATGRTPGQERRRERA